MMNNLPHVPDEFKEDQLQAANSLQQDFSAILSEKIRLILSSLLALDYNIRAKKQLGSFTIYMHRVIDKLSTHFKDAKIEGAHIQNPKAEDTSFSKAIELFAIAISKDASPEQRSLESEKKYAITAAQNLIFPAVPPEHQPSLYKIIEEGITNSSFSNLLNSIITQPEKLQILASLGDNKLLSLHKASANPKNKQQEFLEKILNNAKTKKSWGVTK
jgi:hypothetical protein